MQPVGSIEGLALNILSSISAHHINVVGLSMGGIVAMSMLQLAPERIKRLALLDTNHLADTHERREDRNRQIGAVEEGQLREVITREMMPHYLAACNFTNRAVLQLLVDMAMDLGEEVFISQSLALRDRSDFVKPLQEYRGPACVLCGREDRLCPVERHQEIATLLTNGQLVIVEDAGHISTLENPESVNAALKRWLGTTVQET